MSNKAHANELEEEKMFQEEKSRKVREKYKMRAIGNEQYIPYILMILLIVLLVIHENNKIYMDNNPWIWI